MHGTAQTDDQVILLHPLLGMAPSAPVSDLGAAVSWLVAPGCMFAPFLASLYWKEAIF